MMTVADTGIGTPIRRGFLLLMVALLGLSLAYCSPKQQQPSEQVKKDDPKPIPASEMEDASALRGYFDSLHKAGVFNGVALFARNDSLTRLSLGKRRLRGNDTLAIDDRFQLASLSKPVTALGVLRLVNLGLLDLDTPIQDYLFDFPDSLITVRSMLNHTSGLGNYLYVTDSLWNAPDSFMTNRDVYEIIRCGHLPVYYPPFKRFDYCNTNYAVLPILIEEVSGMRFQEFMRRELFEPIGMFHTEYLDVNRHGGSGYSVLGHYPNGNPKRPFYLDAVVGDKSLYSTVHDLYKLYEELKQPSLWHPSLLQEAWCPDVRSSVGQYYGLGWRIRTDVGGDTLVFHNGWWRGFRSYFWMSPSDDKVAIILTNSIRGGYLSQEKVWSLF